MQLASTTPKSAATAALGKDVGLWIDEHRNGPAQLSYRQIARILAAETDVLVTREALRQWHVEFMNRAA
ncbi:hypothetical protein CH275_04930 [Rhodococcus sp. 06-235-1A]|uniref:hypothetical protein n=1 Tax=Rhodococcus sp. 06-235-1A TaxID=2022508 RepID=UPI000B9AF71E|nr:hypothetical protein [Rhodococcus sp. 06-235-1A]OZD08494.1 hypothetical protein CH275_04930 [Rhodococcus sp. 06-235-1A]